MVDWCIDKDSTSEEMEAFRMEIAHRRIVRKRRAKDTEGDEEDDD